MVIIINARKLPSFIIVEGIARNNGKPHNESPIVGSPFETGPALQRGGSRGRQNDRGILRRGSYFYRQIGDGLPAGLNRLTFEQVGQNPFLRPGLSDPTADPVQKVGFPFGALLQRQGAQVRKNSGQIGIMMAHCGSFFSCRDLLFRC